MSFFDSIKNLFFSNERRNREQHIRERIERFYQTLHQIPRESAGHELSRRWGRLYQQVKKRNTSSNDPIIQRFLHDYETMSGISSGHNAQRMERSLTEYKAFLSDIDGKSLDEQQRTAVVCDAQRTLVIAGAGSGKTLTIAAKVKYLCQIKGVAPEDILLISFTRKAAEEMTGRIRGRLGLDVVATTFHKLGLDILTQASGKRPEVVDHLSSFVRDYFQHTVFGNPTAVRNLLHFLAYYLKIPADKQNFSSLGEAIDAERSADRETIRSKYAQKKYLNDREEDARARKQTLRREQMKSVEEVMIANFLFLNGIEYEYERRYPFASENQNRKAYRPDFYLPEYDLYLEHFGITSDGRAHWLDSIEEQKYLEDMQWKRDFHRQNGTTLLETYSYYVHEGRLYDELARMLTDNGVVLREQDCTDIFRTVYESDGDRSFSEFIRMCTTFLVLYKSGGSDVNELLSFSRLKPKRRGRFHRRRSELFLKIVTPLLTAYNAMLREQGAVDFSDMINYAAALVKGGFQVHPWKWVIVDEYQDCSVARYRLLKAILDQTNAKLLCVGDDWQSIYRFAGSEVSLFTRFEESFGPSTILRLEHTYRNAQQLIDAAGTFIMQNPQQYRKRLRSDKSLEYPIVFLFYEENPRAKLKLAVEKCIQERGPEASVLLLGRTNYDLELLRITGLFQIKSMDSIVYLESPKTPVSFLTVHRSKGLEADNVILLNFRNDMLGFPNRIADDPLLELVMAIPEGFPHAEERRLLYVALTRTRNRVYVLVDQAQPSVFMNEFQNSDSVFILKKREKERHISCPRCKTGYLTMRKNAQSRRMFVGCSNYPECNYTIADTTVLSEPRYCPSCGGFLVRRKGPWGPFYGCSNYPMCDFKETPTANR